MAIVKNGIAKGFSGTIDGLIYSQQPDGTTTVKTSPRTSSKLPTKLQLSSRQDIKICSEFFRPIEDFIKFGFQLEKKLKGWNAHNAAASYLRKNAITGEYPERRIDYKSVLVTKGKMPLAQGVQVVVTELGFTFTWDAKPELKGLYYSDQVMLMAYFPDLQDAVYLTAGAQRVRQTELLMLGSIPKGSLAEVYLSFISDNHKRISNSVHLGQLTW